MKLHSSDGQQNLVSRYIKTITGFTKESSLVCFQAFKKENKLSTSLLS